MFCVFVAGSIFFSLRNEGECTRSERFHISTLRLMFILLIFVPCCHAFQETVAALLSLREGSFIFFCAVLLARVVLQPHHATSLRQFLWFICTLVGI